MNNQFKVVIHRNQLARVVNESENELEIRFDDGKVVSVNSDDVLVVKNGADSIRTFGVEMQNEEEQIFEAFDKEIAEWGKLLSENTASV